MARIGSYIRTIRHLRPVQIAGLARFKFNRLLLSKFPVKLRDYTFRLPSLSVSHRVGTDSHFYQLFSDRINLRDFQWHDGVDRLQKYHLHYFDFLRHCSAEEGIRIIRDWIEKNPPSIQNDGWEPYPISLRMVNWIFFLAGNKISTEKEVVDSLYLQGRWLYRQREMHLLGNHLLKNIVALLFWGYCFSDQKIMKWALANLSFQLNEQFTADGMHYEYSPTYHALAINDVMDSFNLLENNLTDRKKIKTRLREIAGRGVANAGYLSDGKYISVGDVNYQDCPSRNDLKSYGHRLNIGSGPSEVKSFPSLKKNNLKVMMISSPFSPVYNPAHSHGDKLSVLLWNGDVPVLTDTGNYSYNFCDERIYSRSVEAHNTVQIDDLQQAEFWSVFRVGYRGKAEMPLSDSNEISSVFVHRNYRHHRNLEIAEGGLILQDRIRAEGSHSFKQYFHFHPACAIEAGTDRVIVNNSLIIKFSHRFDLIETEYYPEMYRKEHQSTAVVYGEFADRISLTAEIVI